MKNYSRRNFLFDTTKATIALGAGIGIAGELFAGCGPTKAASQKTSSVWTPGYDQAPLPYAYNALLPTIDEQTMNIHYSKHAATYSKNVKEALAEEKVDAAQTNIVQLLGGISKFSGKMRNNAGGHYNHELFWQLMKPGGAKAPTAKLLSAIEKDFGSLAACKTKFEDAAKTRFGSGWAWLLLDHSGKLAIGSSPNQDNPLMDVSELKGTPLLGLDVWEHAYYLKYQNRRPEYITNWWNVVNWTEVQQRYDAVS